MNVIESLLADLNIKSHAGSAAVVIEYLSAQEDSTLYIRFIRTFKIPEAYTKIGIELLVPIGDKQHRLPIRSILWILKDGGAVIETRWPKDDDHDFLREIRQDTSWTESQPFYR